MANVEIIGLPISNYTRAVLMVAEEKRIPYDLTIAYPRSEGIPPVSTFGKIPVLRHGEVELCESRAIAGYLETLVPEPRLFPLDPILAAQNEMWISLVNTVIDRTMIREYVLGYFLPSGAGGTPDRQAIDKAAASLRDQVRILDKAIRGRDYLVGDRLSFADLNLLPILDGIQSFPEGKEAVGEAESLSSYFRLHSERPSFVSTKASLDQ